MKIKTFLLLFLFSVITAHAQVTVVRVQNGQVYLDTSTVTTPVQTGDTFKVILSTEPLINPKTGKNLGPLYHYSEPGTITEVQPLYAVGKLVDVSKIKIGQEAVLQAQPSAAVTPGAATQAANPAAGKLSSRTKITYKPVEQEIIGLSEAQVLAGENNIVTLSKTGQITVWTRAGNSLVQKAAYQLPAGQKAVTLSAAALRGKPTAEIFAVTYDERNFRMATIVLSYENGQWVTLGKLPYFVKEIGCGADKKLWAQRPFVSGVRPGDAHAVSYQDKKFIIGKESRDVQRNWLSGVYLSPEKDGPSSLVYTSSVGQVKQQLPHGKTAAYKKVAVGAANRVKYKQEILKIYPSLQVFESRGNRQVAVAENTAKYGLLSSTFGQYDGGKIHFLSLNNGRFEQTDEVELGGFVYDTACGDNTVLTAEVLPDGQSSVVEIVRN